MGITTKGFHVLDVIVFLGMLGVSAIIGIYQAYRARKSEEAAKEYLSGGNKMSVFPTSMSLMASFISGIAILGIPSEMYVYGTQYGANVFSFIFIGLSVGFIFLPVFYGLQITSSYEYLELRFNHAVRLMGSFIFILDMMMWIPIVIYVPAMAFSQVTNTDILTIAYVVCPVCIFYTCLGGLKAVVWTDTIQSIVMFGGAIIVAVAGTRKVGGVGEVWEKNYDSGRIELFNLDLDPTIRHTFWGVVVGSYFNWLPMYAVNQAMVQRFMSMPSLKKARTSIVIMTVGIFAIMLLCIYTGTILFAAYHKCDPIATQQIAKKDNILPFFVMELSENIYGLPGLFLSGVFSAALSTMSTGLNSMAGVIYEDIIKPCLKRPMSQNSASRVMKLTVVIFGLICVAMVAVVEKLSGIIQAARSLSGITSGVLLGIFSLGVFFPCANSTGVLSSSIVSLLFVGWITFGTHAAIARKIIHYPEKPRSTEGCLGNFTFLRDPVFDAGEKPFFLYTISYTWYPLIGCFLTIILGLLISWMTGGNRYKSVDKKLYAPIIHRFVRDAENDQNGRNMKAKR